MGYQNDYKKVFNTFGPKSQRNAYGIGIGDKVSNLLPNFNIAKNFGKAILPEDVDASEAFYWPKEEKIWYGIGKEAGYNNTSVKFFDYDVSASAFVSLLGRRERTVYNVFLDNVTSEQETQGILIPLNLDTKYNLQIFNNYALGNYNKYAMFLRGKTSEGFDCILYYTAWYKSLSNFIHFQTPKYMFVKAIEYGEIEQHFAVEITGCYLGIRIKNPDLFEDNSMANGYGFLWESENPTEVNEDGIIIGYKDNITAETFVVEEEALYDVPEDEEVYAWLKDPDNAPIITPENSSYMPDACYSVEMPEIFNNDRFYQWLLWRKKNFVLAPLRLHGNNEDSIKSQITLNRKMINERGRQLVGHNRVRKLISWTSSDVVKLDDFTCEWNSTDSCFNKMKLSIDFVNTCKEHAGLEFYDEGGIRHTRLAFCWALRERNNTNEPIPGALYAEIQKYEENPDYYYDSENNLYKSNVIEIRKDIRYEYSNLDSRRPSTIDRTKTQDGNSWIYTFSGNTSISVQDYAYSVLDHKAITFNIINPYEIFFSYSYSSSTSITWTLQAKAYEDVSIISIQTPLTFYCIGVREH